MRAVAQQDRLAAHQVGHFGDQELGRQLRAGGVGRALRLAAPALHAGVEVQPLLPGEIGQRRHAQRRLVLLDLGLQVRDGHQRALGLEIAEEGVDRRVEDMLELRERDRGDERECDQHVRVPEEAVQPQRQRAAAAQPDRAEQRRQRVADIGVDRPGLVVDRDAADRLIRQPQPFEQVAGDGDIQQRGQHPQVGRAVVQPVGLAAVAPPGRPDQAGQKHQAHRVENELEALVERADQDAPGIRPDQRDREILFDGDNVGADKQRQKAEEDQRVHRAGLAILQHALLAEHLRERLDQARRQLVDAHVGLAAAPAADVTQDAPGHHGQGCDCGEVQGERREALADVPVDLADSFCHRSAPQGRVGRAGRRIRTRRAHHTICDAVGQIWKN